MDNMLPPAKYLKMVINPWLLGADPEWAVMTPPDLVVPNSGANAVNTSKSAGEIGSDHGGRVWELRPAPSTSAYVVALNLWKLLQQEELKKLEKFKWKSGALGARKHAAPAHNGTTPGWMQHQVTFYESIGYTHANALVMAQNDAAQHQQQAQQHAQAVANDVDTLGGHVHFGIAGLNPAQKRACDSVTTGLLNLDILPQKENTRRLSISQYGKFNQDATRDCNGHVEYRCAPSWLDKPGQALAALTTYKLAAARPSALKWPDSHNLKADFCDWLEELGQIDVDAWVLRNRIATCGFDSIQADPSSDFKPQWRQENVLPL